MKLRRKNQYSIDDLAEMIISNKKESDERFDKIEKGMHAGFKKVTKRIDKLEHRMDKMEGHMNLIDKRLDKIDKRLDYIVTANKLKDVPNK